MFFSVTEPYEITINGKEETRSAYLGGITIPSTIDLTPNEEKTLEQCTELFVRTLFGATKRRESDRLTYESLKVERLMFERHDLRIEKRFRFADLVRSKIEELGWSVRDYPDRSEAVPIDESYAVNETFSGDIQFVT